VPLEVVRALALLTMSESDAKQPPKDGTKSPKQSPNQPGKHIHKVKHKRIQSVPAEALFPSTGGLGEEAEGYLVKVLEERRARAKAYDANWDASVEGERPPLRRVSFGATAFATQESSNREESSERHHEVARRRFQSLVTQVRSMQSHRQLDVPSSDRTAQNQLAGPSPAAPELNDGPNVFHGVGGADTQMGKSAFSQADTNTDMVIGAAIAVTENFDQDDETISVASTSEYSVASTEGTDEELLPLTGSSGRPQRGGWFSDSAAKRRRRKASRKKWRKRKRHCRRVIRRTCRCDRYWFADLLHPVSLAKSTLHFITSSWFSKVGFPSLVIAFVLFYHLNNPSLDFIGAATLSWWLVFIARQTLTFQLAIVAESIVIDGFALKSRLAVHIFSPLLTLCVISAKGWPFLCVGKW